MKMVHIEIQLVLVSNMQALVTIPSSKAGVRTIPIPKPDVGQILVRVKAVALNPTDAFYVAKPTGIGKTVGSDFAGIVAEVGDNVDANLIGEKVAGFVHGGMWRIAVYSSFLHCS